MGDIYLSVVVPCYNERENLERGVLEEMEAYLKHAKFTWELIISDDGSTDTSREIVRERITNLPSFRLLENPHGGKPSAVWYGIQASLGQVVLFTDMDQSTPLDQFDRLQPLLLSGYDIAIGSRGMERENFPLYRRIGSSVFRAFRRLLLLRHISDTQCGFKAMRAEVARALFPQLDALREPQQVRGWQVTAFDVELLYLAERAGYKIGEAAVTWANRDVAQGKNKSYWRESRHMAEQVFNIILRRIRRD